jgi:hypothetical protein
MAVTRIKNNQITDSTIVANAKVVDYSISASKLANNLTYGSNFTVSGNLTVNGTTTTVDTINTLIQDPILVLADGQTSGAPAVDIGILGYRGNQNSSFIGWKESASTFMAILSNTTVSNTTVNVSSYANFTASTITAQANLSVIGNIVGPANFSGNITGGNILTPGLISATANITGGNILTGGLISATSTITSAANITGANIITGGLVTATGNVTGGNIQTGGLVTVTGNITGGNILTGGLISAAGNISSATNVNTPNVVGASGLTVSTGSGDLVFAPNGNINASGNYINNLRDPGQAQDAATKQYVDDAVSSGIHIHDPVLLETPTPLPAATYAQGGTTATVTSTVAGNTVVFGSAISPQVNDQYWFSNSFQGIVANTSYFVVSAPNTSAAVLSRAYNGLPVSNITSATGLTQSVRINSGVGATLTGNASGALTVDSVAVSANNRILVYQQAVESQNGVYTVTQTGNVSTPFILTRATDSDEYKPDTNDGMDQGSYYYVQSGATGAGESYVLTQPVGPFIIGYDSIEFTQFSASQVYSANTSAGLSLVGTVFSAKVDDVTTAFDGNGNISVKVSANLTTPNIGNATGNSLTLGGNGLMQSTTVSATGNVIGGNVSTAGLITATGNITGGNVNTAGLITASGNVTGGNIRTAGLITATGNITGANLILTSGIVDGPASGRITINGSDIDTDFAVDGDTSANVFYVDAGTGTASFGSSTQVTNAIVNFDTTTSIKTPVGNTAQRPAVGVTGMLRFNTTNNNLELYDNSAWTAVGVPIFTVIADEQFNGDGVTVAFTLGSTQTTNSCIVSINGVVQIPTSAYSVSGTDPTCVLTFTEAPASGDLIDVRQITTTTSVTSIANSSGNAVIAVSPTSAQTNVTGDLSVSGSILGGNLNSTAITSGTSNMSIVSSGGNIRGNIAGTTVMTISPGLVDIQGNLTVSGNATLSGNILGDRIQNGTTQIDIQTPNGNANITVGGTSNVAVFATTGAFITGLASVSGNVTGGNILTGGLISATGAITGAALTGSSLTVSTGNITGGNLLLSGAIQDSGQLDIQTTASNSNIVLTPNGTGNVNISSNVMPTANATANIGSATLSFNTIFAKATSAQYADLAEKYTADAEYAPGTVVAFGGTHEVTLSTQDADRRVAGVVSTNPSYIMNGGLEGANIATVALTGRVPTSVTGTVAKGDLMVSNGDGTARAEADPRAGAIIGKALEDSEGDAVIEVVIGRF